MSRGQWSIYKNNMADSAEQGNSDDNPFSFKSFVKSKKDAKTPRRKQNKTNQNNERSPSSRRKKDIFEEEVPFPDVNEYEIIKSKIFQLFLVTNNGYLA